MLIHKRSKVVSPKIEILSGLLSGTSIVPNYCLIAVQRL